MTRINYSDDDEDFPGQYELWQANCQRSINGRMGQKALRELEAALAALEPKRLIAGELETAEGEVCAIGAVKKYRGVQISSDPEEMEEVGEELGFPRLVAWKVVALNDIEIDGRYVKGEYLPVTPEERYERVLAWTRRQLKEPAV